MTELVLATRNPHKVREFARLLAPVGVLALPDDKIFSMATTQ